MIEVFVKRPVTTVMLVLFMVLMGTTAMFSINIEKDPQVDFPMVSVEIAYPGASPEEVETEIIKLVEEAVSEVSGIEKITAQAYENMALIQVEFLIEEDVNIKLLEVKDKVEAVQNDFPTSVEKPVISKIDILSAPVMTLTLSSNNHSMKDLYEFADKTLKSNFNSVKGVSTVDIIGGDVREIRVYLDSELMIQQFITITDVINGMSQSNVTIAGGEIVQRNNSTSIKFFSEFQNIDDIKNVAFTTAEGKKFKLSDIAIVEDSTADRELTALFNGEDTVLLSIKNAPDGNAIEISEQVRERLPSVRDHVLLEGMTLEISGDTSTYISNETSSTIENIIFGMILTIIIILIFTASFSFTLITALIIPTSLVATMFLVSAFEFTINSMTLLALASVLGTLIANALIIIESALTLISKGKSPEEAAIEGTKSVVLPVFASSGTNLAVFIPIAFMGGMVGKFMIQFGLTIVFATILSIVISFTLTPMLIAKFMRPSKQGKQGKKAIGEKIANWINNFFIESYRPLFNFFWRFKIIALALSALLMYGSILIVGHVGIEFSPTSDVDEINIIIKTPQGSTIEKTTEKTLQIDEIVRKHKEVFSTVATIGENGETNANIQVNLIPLAERPHLSDSQLIELITAETSDIPEITIDMTRGAFAMDADIVINLYGVDYNKLIQYSETVKTKMQELGVFRSLNSSYQLPKNEKRFIPNQEKLNLYGINNAQIGAAVRASVYGDTSNNYRDNGETYDINVLLNEYSRNSEQVFENIYVPSPQGLVPISELGNIVEVKAFSEINRRDKERIIELSGYLGKSTLGQVQTDLNKMLSEISFEEGYGFYYAGNAEMSADSNQELGTAAILAVLLTYMVLAAVLNSYLHPFTISTSIITSFSCVFVMLFLTDSTISMPSMLAMIMLIGLSVNNSILIVENAVFKITKQGFGIKDALWDSYESKIRTVLMTSIAIMLGMVPQMFSPDGIKSSMSAVIIGGMIASMIFTFLLTPTMFFILEKIRTFSLKALFAKKTV